MNPGRYLKPALLLALALAMSCAGGASTPRQAVELFYAAMAKGDLAAMQELTTGNALEGLKKSGRASGEEMTVLQICGRAFDGVAKVEEDGDRASASGKWNRQRIASGFLSLTVAQSGQPDPAAMKAMEAHFNKLADEAAAELESFTLTLTRVDGNWYIADFGHAPAAQPPAEEDQAKDKAAPGGDGS